MADANFIKRTADRLLDVIEVELKIPLGIAEIKFKPTEVTKKWRENKEKRAALENAIQRAEEKFVAKHHEEKVAQIVHSFPLHSDEEFKNVIAGLLTHLSEEKITWLAEIKIEHSWNKNIGKEDIRNAIELYLPFLRHELNGIKEFREIISALTLERIDQKTEKINKTTERIEDKLDEALKSKQDKPVTLNKGWFYGHRYGDLESFTGRAAEMKMLDEWLSNDKDNLLMLRALGGFGKSALA